RQRPVPDQEQDRVAVLTPPLAPAGAGAQEGAAGVPGRVRFFRPSHALFPAGIRWSTSGRFRRAPPAGTQAPGGMAVAGGAGSWTAVLGLVALLALAAAIRLSNGGEGNDGSRRAVAAAGWVGVAALIAFSALLCGQLIREVSRFLGG